MKIVIATALYPPDIAEPAPYIKELAKRLAKKHDVTVVSYGYLPEKISGVSFVSVDKRNPLVIRLLQFTFELLRAMQNADVLYAENGASVELPMILVSLIRWKRYILHIGDKEAHARVGKRIIPNIIETIAYWRAHKVLDEMPTERPEILPFENTHQEALDSFEKSWEEHLEKLESELV